MDLRSEALTSPPQEGVISYLVQRAAQGNKEAYGEIYGLYVDRIYRYVFYYVKDRMLAEDITEEVFIKAWRAIYSCQGKENAFGSWLYRIAHNHTIDTLRKNSRNVPLEGYCETDSIDVSHQVEMSLEAQNLRELISELPESQRQIILLKFIEGIDNEEIEKITGKRQGAIRALQMRALIGLRKALKERSSNRER